MTNNEELQDDVSFQEAKRMRELLTPLSIITALQLTVFLYFSEKQWTELDELLFPLYGTFLAWAALCVVITYGIISQWGSKEEQVPAIMMRWMRRFASFFTVASLLCFGIAVYIIQIKIT